MKKYLLFVVVLLSVNVLFWYGIGPVVFHDKVLAPDAERVEPVVVDVFTYTLREEVDKKLGVPIEGYEPGMFMEVFPGFTATDFAGVDASLGEYQFAAGELRLVIDETELIHNAAGAITRDGMETLLYNVGRRIGVDVRAEGTITDVMRYLIAAQ